MNDNKYIEISVINLSYLYQYMVLDNDYIQQIFYLFDQYLIFRIDNSIIR